MYKLESGSPGDTYKTPCYKTSRTLKNQDHWPPIISDTLKRLPQKQNFGILAKLTLCQTIKHTDFQRRALFLIHCSLGHSATIGSATACHAGAASPRQYNGVRGFFTLDIFSFQSARERRLGRAFGGSCFRRFFAIFIAIFIRYM